MFDELAYQASFEPAPISPKKPFKPVCWSHAVAAASLSAPIVDDTHVSEVPEPSESRYWCISSDYKVNNRTAK